MKIIILSSAAVALATSVAAAQSTSAAKYPAPHVVLSSATPASHVTHNVMTLRTKGDSVFRPFGKSTEMLEPMMIDGVSAVRNVTLSDWANGKRTVDTTYAVAATLAPIGERTTTPSRIVNYDFAGRVITGQIGPVGTAKAINDTLPEPAYNSTDLPLVFERLPFSEGYHVALPLYDPEFPGFRRADIKVTGTESLTTPAGVRQVYVVTMSEPTRSTPLYFRVDAKTRETLQMDYVVPSNGAEFRTQRVE